MHIGDDEEKEEEEKTLKEAMDVLAQIMFSLHGKFFFSSCK